MVVLGLRLGNTNTSAFVVRPNRPEPARHPLGDSRANALIEAALDTGHYLVALERFTTVCDFFPCPELRSPELDLKVASAG